METIINKAIEGNYLNITDGWEFKDDGLRTFRPKDDAPISYRSEYQLFLDPLFWQALGNSVQCFSGEDVWQFYAVEFFKLNLTEGFESAVAWLSNLIKE